MQSINNLSLYFLLDVPKKTLIQRLTGRRVCRDCGVSFHVVNMPPKNDNTCDSCGGELYQRKDDNAETIGNRLDVYARQTQPLISHYESKGLLTRLAGDHGISSLMRDITRIF